MIPSCDNSFTPLGPFRAGKPSPLSDSIPVIPFFDRNITESVRGTPHRDLGKQGSVSSFVPSRSLSFWKRHSAPCRAKLRTINSRDRELFPLCLLPKKDVGKVVSDLQALERSPEVCHESLCPGFQRLCPLGLLCQLC